MGVPLTKTGATGSVYPEVINGKETGSLKTTGTFYRFDPVVKYEKRVKKVPVKFLGFVYRYKTQEYIKKVVSIKKTDLGKTINPQKITK